MQTSIFLAVSKKPNWNLHQGGSLLRRSRVCQGEGWERWSSKNLLWANYDIWLCYVPVKSKLQHSPPPPGQPPRAFEFFGKFLFKFPPPEAEKLFKCAIIGAFQVIKCPHPRETFRYLLLCSGSCVCKHGLIDRETTLLHAKDNVNGS